MKQRFERQEFRKSDKSNDHIVYFTKTGSKFKDTQKAGAIIRIHFTTQKRLLSTIYVYLLTQIDLCAIKITDSNREYSNMQLKFSYSIN